MNDNEEPSPSAARPVTFEVWRRDGVWSVYRNYRALHRSRDRLKIEAQASRLARAEADRSGRPVRVVRVGPVTGDRVEYLFRPDGDPAGDGVGEYPGRGMS